MPDLLAAPVLAVSAFEAGEAAGGLLIVAIGVALLLVGLSRRRTSRREAAVWSAHGAPGDAQPGSPSGRPPERGQGLIIAGVIVALLPLVTVARDLVDRAGSDPDREVGLPASVLSLPRNEALTAQAEGLGSSGADDQETALYGEVGAFVLVAATTIDDEDPDDILADSVRGFEDAAGIDLDEGVAVDPGALGGQARCWNAELQGLPIALCAFIDRVSLVTTVDSLVTDVQGAADRGRTVREACLS